MWFVLQNVPAVSSEEDCSLKVEYVHLVIMFLLYFIFHNVSSFMNCICHFSPFKVLVQQISDLNWKVVLIMTSLQ